MRFFILIYCFLSTSVFAEHALSTATALSYSSFGVFNSRPTSPEEYPAALHIIGYEDESPETSKNHTKCGGIAVGTCMVTASHCLDSQMNFLVRNPKGERSKISSKNIRRNRNHEDESIIFGNDIAVVKLDTPLSYSETLDIFDFDFVAKTGKIKEFNRTNLEAIALKNPQVLLTGFGEDVSKDKILANVESASSKKAAAMGALFRYLHAFLDPRHTEGKARFLGHSKELLHDENKAFLLSYKEDALKNLSDADKILYASKIKNLESVIKSKIEDLENYESIFLLPNPGLLTNGDSGSPAFHEVNGKKKVFGLNSGVVSPTKAFTTAEKILAEINAMVITPIGFNREFIESSYKELGCDKK